MDKQPVPAQVTPRSTRRTVLKLAAAGLSFPAYLRAKSGFAAGRKIKIGYVGALSGPLAAFSEPNEFVFEQVNKIVGSGINGSAGTFEVEWIIKDNKSLPKLSKKMAHDLIGQDEVDLMLASDTPETINPVADLCEYYEVPCITTVAPWQSYFHGRKGNLGKGFEWTYHFYWGMEDALSAFVSLWDQLEVNKVVGGLFPDDIDGRVWGDVDFGLPPELEHRGYRFVDGGRYQPLTKDFSQQIALFKEQGAEIVTGVPIPPDFIAFWKQCGEQDYKPKVVTIAKALLFPSVVNAMGERGAGLSCGVSWAPTFPFKSGLTGESASELAANYTAATNRPWTQPLGFRHALLEVTIDVLKRAADPTDRNALKQAILETDYDSIIGKIRWGGPPVKNVCQTPVVGGQWQKKDDGSLEVVVVDNNNVSFIPKSSKLSILA
jgi:branched-chain amino acid transport system substrate-binding protein